MGKGEQEATSGSHGARLVAAFADRTRGLEDPDAIVRTAMRLLREQLGADRCVYAEVDEHDRFTDVIVDAAPGVPEAHGSFALSALGQDAAPELHAGRPFVTEDLDPAGGGDVAELVAATGTRALVTVPVLRGGRVVARTGIHALAPRRWTEEEVALVRDITERLWESIERARVARDLRASEARYRSMVDGQTEMLCRFRRDGVILFVNRAYAEARGTTPEALEGRDFWGFIPAEEQPAVRAMLDQLTPAAPGIRIENHFRTEAGERWTLWSNRALRFDADGRWLEAQSSGLDISERRRMEEALRDADRRKDEFLAMLAHELRNPLAPIRNAVEVLTHLGLPDPRQQRACEVIARQADVLARLVDDLLDVARFTQGKVKLVREPVDLAQVVATAVEGCRAELDAREQRLEVMAPPDGLVVVGDPTRLVQVVFNVLHNAVKYTHEGGRIRVLVERRGEAASVVVSDDGRGIDPELLPRVFELFVQATSALDRAQGGLGVGLTLVRQLVELHGGQVEARSDGVGKGTEVRVTLPLTELVEAPEPAAGDGRDVPLRRRILVVEDNEDAADVLAMMLELQGHEVRVARDGEEGLAAAISAPPDVALCDLGLPRLDGFELAARLRSRRELDGTWLVALTGYGRDEDRKRAREVGFDEHLVKPLDPRALEATLARLVRPRV